MRPAARSGVRPLERSHPICEASYDGGFMASAIRGNDDYHGRRGMTAYDLSPTTTRKGAAAPRAVG